MKRLHFELHMNIDLSPEVLGVDDEAQATQAMNQLRLEVQNFGKVVDAFKNKVKPFTNYIDSQITDSECEELDSRKVEDVKKEE
jgi:hypothetical protein